ncbi:MAG: hypothetical protein WCT15_00560 [Candidatus Omnitrophota bacterium]
MYSSRFKLSMIRVIMVMALLAVPMTIFANMDVVEKNDGGSNVVIDGSDTEILCGDAVNIGSTTKADKIQNNNGKICIVADDDKDNIVKAEIN